MPSCPECNSENVSSEWDDRHSSEGHSTTHHVCGRCGCEFDTEETLYVMKHGSHHTNEEA
jgi:transcription elongation factor Elf1